MLKNYIKIAWRNISRNKVFSVINIMGLAIGIAASLLILQYVAFELSYERSQEKGDRIYRVRQERYEKGQLTTSWAAGAFAIGNYFKDAFPEIEDYVKLVKQREVLLDDGQRSVKVSSVYWASSAYFKVFSTPLVSGDPATALAAPNTIVLSESIARKLFGNEDPIGKIVRENHRRVFKVTGVYKDMPSNTHLKPEAMYSYASYLDMVKPDNPETAWQWDGCLTYLMLRADADPRKLEAKFPALVNRYYKDVPKEFTTKYFLQPLKDIHLYSHLMMEAETNGQGNTVYLLMGIALFIVGIAWINYINLATARAINRAVEVGVRKAVGSRRSQLVAQFMIESVMLNGMAVVTALFLVVFSIPLFNSVTGQQLSFSLLYDRLFWTVLMALFVTGSFLSGLYPAFVLSRFKPVVVLKGKAISSRQGSTLRKSLVVVQFAASLFLLVGMLTVFKQIQFMRSQQLGINIAQTLVIKPPIIYTDSTRMQQQQAFKEQLMRESNIRSVTVSSIVPGEASSMNVGGIRLIEQNENEGKQFRAIHVDYDFVPSYHLKLVAGRNFDRDFGMDGAEGAVVFNRTGIRRLGFDNPESAVGKLIFFWGDTLRIAGVVEDFHQQSLHDAYESLILRLRPDVKGYISVGVSADNLNATLATVQRNWNTFFPASPFEYFFLDEHFDEQYKADQRFGKVFGIFTALAILVACLGLFGLASFTIVQRTKEISIRKILGASVPEIVQLLYREFAVLIVIAFGIATPVAWFSVTQWLKGYAFRTELYWWLFAIPFVLVLAIAFLTVSFQSIRAALVNPAHSLRSE
ncbi:ABC transporter permease [Chitinophaga oryzae]|uniref:ABC transporter permease n=1 Tax=Chitinophaga oryzae TaxID=2725414 RepID=A0AAE6ZC76_9BACT|nr:ABC transporter permease [Chitinophaga oryzae]QJB30011.1 ABC transporter permease [Chitinophaga oryzae]QJB36508.1 ABC transporter permease [Chitinophaga oryzae]